jgi:glutamate-1-semialdehyde 2,1-aminomutase
VIGGGFPAAAFGGKKKIMQHLAPLGQVYQAGTLSGNPVAMRAGLSALGKIEKEGFYEELERKTFFLFSPIRQVVKEKNIPVCIHQLGSCFSFFWGIKEARSQEDLKNLDVARFIEFFQFLFDRGVYLSPSVYETCFVSSAHTNEQLEYTRTQILEFIDRHS